MRAMSASSGIVCAARGKHANAGLSGRVWRCLGAAAAQGSAGVRVVPRFIDRHPRPTVLVFAVRILEAMLRARGDDGHKNALLNLPVRPFKGKTCCYFAVPQPPGAHLVEQVLHAPA